MIKLKFCFKRGKNKTNFILYGFYHNNLLDHCAALFLHHICTRDLARNFYSKIESSSYIEIMNNLNAFSEEFRNRFLLIIIKDLPTTRSS